MTHGYRNIFGEERIQTALFETGTGNVVKIILTDWFFGTTSIYYGILKRWTGAAWVKSKLKVWNSSQWVNGKLKFWSGTEWKLIDTTGI